MSRAFERALERPRPAAELQRFGDALVGRWNIEGWFEDDPVTKIRGWQSDEWQEDGMSIVRRWEAVASGTIERGAMVIGYDEESHTCVGRYAGDEKATFRMAVENGVYTMKSNSHRFRGRFSEGGASMTGRWERSSNGSNWRYWYDVTYRKLR